MTATSRKDTCTDRSTDANLMGRIISWRFEDAGLVCCPLFSFALVWVLFCFCFLLVSFATFCCSFVWFVFVVCFSFVFLRFSCI